MTGPPTHPARTHPAPTRPDWLRSTNAALWSAVGIALVAVSPPVDAVTEHHLSAHMVQHVVLIGLVAPLLALGAPAAPGSRRLPPGPALAGAVALQTFVLLAWHAPAAFEAAERSALLHPVEHLTLVGSAALLWWVAIKGGGPAGWGPGALAVFLASFPMTALGLGMVLSRTPWYGTYPDVADQQLAGVVMWSGGGLLALVGFLALGVAWVHRSSATGP
jgi:cytochrome c oxidase assembly factor CtaG